MLEINNLSVSVADHIIVDQLSLTINPGTIHALMGPNGSGKSTLSMALMGHPYYQINSGSVSIDGRPILTLKPEEKASMGLFLSFQHPVSIPGITVTQLIYTSLTHLHKSFENATEFKKALTQYCEVLDIKADLLNRYINDGFSGGERKRIEMLQLLMSRPKYAIIDEIDSGLDVDSIKSIGSAIVYAASTFSTGFLIVTHYRRILDHLNPTKVHLLVSGKVIQTGSSELINRIDSHGFKQIVKTVGV